MGPILDAHFDLFDVNGLKGMSSRLDLNIPGPSSGNYTYGVLVKKEDYDLWSKLYAKNMAQEKLPLGIVDWYSSFIGNLPKMWQNCPKASKRKHFSNMNDEAVFCFLEDGNFLFFRNVYWD